MTAPASPVCEISFRVRYVECDPMGYLHHSCYLVYMEMGRVELLRQSGHTYRQLEADGALFVVTKAEINYRRPAHYDDQLRLRLWLTRTTAVRFEHAYELYHADTNLLLATAATTIACVDRTGTVQPIPAHILAPAAPTQK